MFITMGVKLRGRRAISENKSNRRKWHPKINIYCKFHQSWIMGKYSKPSGKAGRKRGETLGGGN